MQALCEWGRESLESWGRKKRSLPSNETGDSQNKEENMNISQEILVLDFGDDRQSTDFLRSDKPGGTASEANFGGKKINSRLSTFCSFLSFFVIFILKDVNIDFYPLIFHKKFY